MNLNQANKRVAMKKATQMAYNTIEKGLSRQQQLVMLLVLHDKFGFGPERCAKAVEAWEDLWDSYARQHLDLEDIADVVRDELHLEIEDDMIYKLGKNGERIPFKGR